MSVAVYLDVKAVSLRLQGQTRDDVLRELVRLIPELQDRAAEQATVWQSLMDREKLQTTAVGDGLAFPHARSAMGSLLKKPVVVVGRHEKGIPWAAPDLKPVQLFFLLAAPNLTEHLRLLSQMSRILRNPKVRLDLLSSASAESVIGLLQAAEEKIPK